jgi:hypothetical protein
VIYNLIGRFVVKTGIFFIRQRYGTQLRFALGFGLAAALIGAYLASREVREG